MDHPPDAALQPFWQIHELSDAIERRLVARGWQPLRYTGSEGTAALLSKNGRKYLLSTVWSRVCMVLDDIEIEKQLSSHSRLLLRVCLGSANHFVGLVLHHFYERSVLERLLSKQDSVSDLYSIFFNYVKNNAIELWNRLDDLQQEKHELIKIRIQLRQSYNKAKFYVHRVSYPPYTATYSSPSLGKRIVIDPSDLTKFLNDDFYVMQSAEAFIVKPQQEKKLEIHVFITDECPWDSTQLEESM